MKKLEYRNFRYNKNLHIFYESALGRKVEKTSVSLVYSSLHVSIPEEVWRVFLQNLTQNLSSILAQQPLEALEEHLGADADHDEVGEPPGTDEDPHELEDAPGDLEEHVPAP